MPGEQLGLILESRVILAAVYFPFLSCWREIRLVPADFHTSL